MQSNIVKGSLFAIFAFFCMAAFGIFTKIACEYGNYIWVSLIAYIVATACTAIFIFPQGFSALKSQHYRLLVARAVIGTCASFLYMLSMHYISVVNSTLLFNTAPIFIPILSVCILHNKVQTRIWFAVVLGFIGILFIIRPGEDIFVNPGNFIGLLSGIALAIAYLIMKTLTNTDLGLRIIFYYFSIGTVMQLPLLWLTDNIPSNETIGYAALSGIMLVLAQISLVKAYQNASASEVGVYQYSSVVFVGMMEWLLWSMTPGFLDIIGFILVSIAGIFIISLTHTS